MTTRKVEEDCLKLTHHLRSAFLALFLSLTLTLILAVVYISYPFILEISSAYFRNPETAGIGAVAGGVSESFLKILLILAVTLFLIFFALLQRMQAKR